MKTRNHIFRKYFTAFVLLIPLVIAISFVQTKLNDIKEQEKLTDTNIIKNAPPVVAFVTIALGSFRGLLADILWLRTTKLQDQGQYFEMVQLASWITKLQPRFTGGTAFLAWNMAYNISVTCSSFEDRWRWVRRGIELIRDEALVYNPGDPLLYKELGWIYQHKIGNMMDDAHQYYKNRMAVDMMSVFGKAELDWDALAAAPKTEKELDETLKLDNDFWNDLASGKDDKVGGYQNMKGIEKDFRLFGSVPEKVKNALKYDKKRIALLDNYLRGKWIKEKYKLDPVIVAELNHKYGNLDWRLPESHAIYWATMGIKNDPSGNINQFCDRMITQSLQAAFMGGKLVMADPDNPESFLTIPNLNLADSAVKSFQDAYKHQDNSSFKSGLRNFLKDVIVMMYTFGKYEKAEKYMKMLRKQDPNNPSVYLPLDKFVLKQWREDARSSTIKQARGLVGSQLYQGFYLYSCNEDEAAEAHMKLAEGVYRVYKEEQKAAWPRMGFSFDDLKTQMKELCRQNLLNLKKYSEERKRIEMPPSDAPTRK